jgi:hypothetical protein
LLSVRFYAFIGAWKRLKWARSHFAAERWTRSGHPSVEDAHSSSSFYCRQFRRKAIRHQATIDETCSSDSNVNGQGAT